MSAAMELFGDPGFEQTTVADIAERAGVTERTFFRHFADKREVLFDGSHELMERVVATVVSAPDTMSPVEKVVVAFEGVAPLIDERRDYAAQRWTTIAANPALQERELLKMASLAAAAAAALRSRGVTEPAATLAAETGVTAFKVGYETWVTAPTGDLALCIRTTFDELKALTAPP